MTEFQSIFGLTAEQARILFSFERFLAKKDAEGTRDATKKLVKNKWVDEWSSSVEKTLRLENNSVVKSENSDSTTLYHDEDELVKAIKSEISASANQTWYHLVLLEVVVFEAYTPLGEDESMDKAYKKVTFKTNLDHIKGIVEKVGIGTTALVDQYAKSYDRALGKATGRTQKLVRNGLIVLAAAGVIAATAGVAAGPIATLLVGSQYAGLYGVALVNACLAALGGGAIAAGGAGIAGGVMVIVGGGALLGAAASSATVAGVSVIAETCPDLAISQGAKLTVVLREIILNGQKDIILAQGVLENFKSQIVAMQAEMAELKLKKEQDKKAIQNLQTAIAALEKLYRDGNVFTSSFEIGMQAENRGAGNEKPEQ